jgi:transmembrane sensor
LFAAADAARLAGHPAGAVAPLTAVFTRHPGDPRAAVAAYQLGRVLAFDLHDSARAAAAFARAHDLDPSGPLAADAAAHAAEARAQGEKTK